MARYSSKTVPVYYHLVAETKSPDVEGCVDQMLMSCLEATPEILEDFLLTVSKKYMELIE